MIIYLDQNHWIHLARLVHGKAGSKSDIQLIAQIRAALASGCVLPLSHIHYIETHRIADAGRRARLGAVMWEFSGGVTMASVPTILEHELEVALARNFPTVRPAPFTLLGRGIAHTFGRVVTDTIRYKPTEEMERMILVGDPKHNLEPPRFKSVEHRENFFRHLTGLQRKKLELPRSQWEDWLHAICLTDVLDPLNRLMLRHGIPKDAMSALGKERLKQFVQDMPTRRLDVHLHHQVLKNSAYHPKKTDLEDWAGIGAAACYCDVVICEKHMASMLKRDGFKTRARIETNLGALFGNARPL